MMGIFYILAGILVVAIGYIFFYKNKQKQLCLNAKQEPVIQLNIADSSLIIPRLDGTDHFINDIIVHDSMEEEQAVIIDKEANEPDNMDIVMLQIKALADRPYVGYELLQALTSAGLNFGKMNIFHGNDFSVAAATIEGSFPIDSMGSFKCLGLMIFMKLDPNKKLMMTFDLMLDTAKQLAEELGGEIYSDLNQPINTDTIRGIREKIFTIEANIL